MICDECAHRWDCPLDRRDTCPDYEEDQEEITHQVLCGCGWGNLAMPDEQVRELTGCPVCCRPFDYETGWQ